MNYTCPMHPEIKSSTDGRCTKCGMKLVLESDINKVPAEFKQTKADYKPLIIIFVLILLASSTITVKTHPFSISNFIENFMIGFFLVFSGFKLVDLKGFAEGYSTYDLLARKWFGYGYIYPFIELFFGLSMIIGIYKTQILWAEVVIMAFSGIGVAIKLLKKEKFQCACLGTFLKVPLTKVTLIEDFGMSLLALFLLLYK